jgi:hypothetical protein
VDVLFHGESQADAAGHKERSEFITPADDPGQKRQEANEFRELLTEADAGDEKAKPGGNLLAFR